jgi:hypothetical protein
MPTEPTMNWQTHIPGERLTRAKTNGWLLHTNGSHQEEVTTTHLLNQVQTREGRNDIDRVRND